MHPYVLLPLVSGVAAAMAASAILTRDRSHRAHRVTAAILLCAAYWSLLEVLWNPLDDADAVITLIRLSSLGWTPLGVLAIHLFVEVIGESRLGLRRFLPALYGVAGVSIVVYVATPLGIASVHPTSWGWAFRHGPLFPWLYAPPALLAGGTLVLLWRHLVASAGSAGERRQGHALLVGISLPLFTASLTDAVLPMLGVDVPRLGAASMTAVGAAIAWSIHRDGYSVLAPGTFAPEMLATFRDGVALLRLDGLIRTANGSLARLCGCEPAELLGRPIGEILPGIGARSEDGLDLECTLEPVAGFPVPVSVSTSTLRDRRGEPAGRVLCVRDLREVVTLRSHLVMSGRLAAVGELAAGIAHEINNPIAFVQASLHHLQERWKELELHRDGPVDRALLDEGEEILQESLSGVARVASIVQDVRGFARAGRPDREQADLNELLESTLRIARPQLRGGVEVDRRYGDLPRIECSPEQLMQVFLNVVLNAAHAVSEGGRVRLETRRDGEEVVAAIADDGCGMDAAVLERIFDPFFTTKPVGEGMGLGLSISYQIVRDHGGQIEVASEPGVGTSFQIRLPVVADRA